MDLNNVSALGKQKSDDFKSHADQDSTLPDAMRDLQGLSMADALISCMQLAIDKPDRFEALGGRALGTERADFVVRLIRDGRMPQGSFNGVGQSITGSGTGGHISDYHTARLFILTLLASPLKQNVWPRPDPVGPKNFPFFPEVLSGFSQARQRMVALANAHINLAPTSDKQRGLFSLGGFYNLNGAVFDPPPSKDGTPQGTSCIIFARSVLHAAGFNVITDGVTPAGNCRVKGLLAELPGNQFGLNRSVKTFDALPQPHMGDIFWIQGDNFPGGFDSTHVGIVISTAGNRWDTIEGGGGDHVTRPSSRELIKVAHSMGKWAFKDDNTKAGVRPLQGIYEIDNIADARKMSRQQPTASP
jgi:hypothetical protein